MVINIVIAVLAITFHCARRDSVSLVNYPPGLETSTENNGLQQDIRQQAPGQITVYLVALLPNTVIIRKEKRLE